MRDGHLTVDRNTDLDALRGTAVCLVVSSHFFWIFFPNLVIGNFHAIEALSGASPFPLFNLPFPNVLAVTVLLAVSGYASVVAFAARPVRPALAFDISHRYLRLVLPAIAAGALAYSLSVIFDGVNVAASKLIYGNGIPSWLAGLWSEPPTLHSLAKEFLLGRVTQTTSLLPVLWMMPDLFVGSIATLLGLRFVPHRYNAIVFLTAGILMLFIRPLMAAVILGALIGLFVRSRPTLHIPIGMRLSLLLIALIVGLNPIGSGTGGLTLLEWYSPWLPKAAAWPATALAGVMILLAFLPRPSDAARIGGRLGVPGALALLAAIGRRSYTLYLLHLPVLLTFASATFVLLAGVGGHAVAIAGTVLATIATLAIIVPVVYWLVETPISRTIVRWR